MIAVSKELLEGEKFMQNHDKKDIQYKSEIYIASMIKNDQRYIYLQGDFAIEYLSHLSSASQNQLICEVFSQEPKKLLKINIDFHVKCKGNIIYFKSLQRKNIAKLHNILIQIQPLQMHWIELPWKNELLFRSYQPEYNENLDGQDWLILSKSGNKYVIEECTNNIETFVDGEESLYYQIQNGLFHEIFDLCLKQNMPVYYYFTPSQMKKKVMKINLFPLLNKRKKRIFIYFQYRNTKDIKRKREFKELLRNKRRKERLFAVMTPREKEVAEKVLNGSRNKEISSELFISEGTVKRTVYNIYQKFGVTTRVEFVQLFMIDKAL